jgi:hypothetical protein
MNSTALLSAYIHSASNCGHALSSADPSEAQNWFLKPDIISATLSCKTKPSAIFGRDEMDAGVDILVG